MTSKEPERGDQDDGGKAKSYTTGAGQKILLNEYQRAN